MPRRAGAPLKKTPPTTVRFTPELHEFVKARGESHADGQSGVINDAVAFYKAHVESDNRRDVLYESIVGANGHGT